MKKEEEDEEEEDYMSNVFLDKLEKEEKRSVKSSYQIYLEDRKKNQRGKNLNQKLKLNVIIVKKD